MSTDHKPTCPVCGGTVTGWSRPLAEHVDVLGKVFSDIGTPRYDPCGHLLEYSPTGGRTTVTAYRLPDEDSDD